MHLELWQGLIASIVALLGGGGLFRLLTSGADLTKTKTDSAIALMTAYGEQLDRHKEDIERLTTQSVQQQEQITNLLGLVGTRDQELATVRAELATERAKNAHLLTRVDSLERQINSLPRRYDDPSSPPRAA